MRYKIQVHHQKGHSVNVDTFTCIDAWSDLSGRTITLIDGADEDGPVKSAQYWVPWRILVRPVPDEGVG